MKSNDNEVNDVTPDAAPSMPETVKIPDTKPAKPPVGRLARFGRTLLTWLIVIVIAFLAGVLTFNFALYQPLAGTLTQTQAELAKANKNLSQVTADVTAVNEQLTGLKADNQAMQSELEAATAHLGLLQALANVNSARLALVADDIPAAKAALKDTAAQLETLAPKIAEVDANLAKSMPQRLTLILSGLDSDVETAKVDLEVLSGNLLSLETLLFKK